MIAAIRAELRKIFTVRSTYFILAAALGLIGLFAGFIEGWRADKVALANHGLLAGEVTSAVATIGVLTSIIALLLLAHEYRYNTIMYTLTAARSRSRVLVAKIIAITIFILPVTAFFGALSPLVALAGIHLHGLHLVSQQFNFVDLAWRSLFYGWAYVMFAMVFVALIRNQVGAIVVFFVVPSTVENLAGLLLKDNVKYLPFTSLQSIIMPVTANGVKPLFSVIVASSYLLGAWIVAWVLFLRRDAN